MNARAAIARPWNFHSVVAECSECEGKGDYWQTQGRNDPDACTECPHCEGVGHHACGVCGFDTIIPGYDCLICQMVGDIPDALLTDKNVADTTADMTKAIARAINAANLALETRKAGAS